MCDKCVFVIFLMLKIGVWVSSLVVLECIIGGGLLSLIGVFIYWDYCYFVKNMLVIFLVNFMEFIIEI